MKVLVLAPQPFFQLRGTPIAVHRVVQILGDAGHSIDLLTFHEGDDVTLPNCSLHRIPRIPWVNNVPPGFSFRKIVCDVCMLFKAVSLCRHNSFDLVHAVEESAFIAIVLKTIFRTPYLYDMDSSLPEQLCNRIPLLRSFTFLLKRIERLAISRSHGVIAVCHALEDIVHKESPSTPVVRMEDVSPHSVSAKRDRISSPLPDAGRPLIVYVGNLQPYQGIELLVESFSRVSDSFPEAMLAIVGGSDSDIRKYRQLTTQLGIDDRVDFCGMKPLESIPDYLQAADLVVSPRIQGTNTPMKVYSYMESGTPLIATRLKTHTQVLDDSMCWLADPDPKSFSAAIINAWQDGERSNQLAAVAKGHAAEHFSAEVQDDKLIIFYVDVESRIRRQAAHRIERRLTTTDTIREAAK